MSDTDPTPESTPEPTADRPAPTSAALRELGTPAAKALADLAGTFEDLQTALRCCERLIVELGRVGVGTEIDDLAVESLWTTALLSYARCFAGGRRGMGLTEDDLKGLELQGDVLEWHSMLLRAGRHYANVSINPRERFAVAASQDDAGRPEGVALTSVRQPLVDHVTVRQTGAIAYSLSQLVDERIGAQLKVVSAALDNVTPAELGALPVIEVVPV